MNKKMKSKGLILLTVLFLAANFAGCAKKSQSESDTAETTNTEVSSTMDFKRIGSEQLGYVNIPSSWLKFRDLDETVKDLQYSDPAGTTIVTMNLFDKKGLSEEDARNFGAEEAANNVWASLRNSGAADIQGSTVKLKHYDTFQVSAIYSDGSRLVAWLFEAEDNEIHYVAVESPSEERFMQTVKLISESYSLKE